MREPEVKQPRVQEPRTEEPTASPPIQQASVVQTPSSPPPTRRPTASEEPKQSLTLREAEGANWSGLSRDDFFGFRYCAPGVLRGAQRPELVGDALFQREVGGDPSRIAHAPDMLFPIEFDPSSQGVVLNSQVYYPGGSRFDPAMRILGVDAGGGWRDAANLQFPSYDTFGEFGDRAVRHQGQDIRPVTMFTDPSSIRHGRPDAWWAVAPFEATVEYAAGHRVTLVAVGGGARVTFKHLKPFGEGSVARFARTYLNKKNPNGQAVTVPPNERIAFVSSFSTDKRTRMPVEWGTTPHLHFEMMSATRNGWEATPPYASLIAAYRAKLGLTRNIDGSTGELRVDAAYEVANCPTDIPLPLGR